MQRFGIGITTLVVVQRTQIVEGTCHIGMVGTERFLVIAKARLYSGSASL